MKLAVIGVTSPAMGFGAGAASLKLTHPEAHLLEPKIRAAEGPTLDGWLDELAGGAPVPGGGSAAALAGALAAALVAMVARLTIGRKAYADVQQRVAEIVAEAEALRAQLRRLVDDDAAAYAKVSAAYRLPKDDPRRTRAADEALVGAAQTPLAMARGAARLVGLAREIGTIGNRNAHSDAMVAEALARAALAGAVENVRGNVQSIGGRKHPRRATLVENGHRVLEVGGQRPILGDHGPLVVQGADVRAADVHHGLDGEGHAGHEPGAALRLAVVRHLRVLVERRSDTVSDQLPHHRVARYLRHPLHCVTDVAHVVAGPSLGDASRQRLLGHREQPLRLRTHLPDGEGRRRVGVQPVEPHADVHAQEIAFLEDAARGRYPVDDLLVDRRAQGGGEVVQSFERRAGAGVRADEVLGGVIELLGGDAASHLTRDQSQGLRHDAAGGGHRLDLARRLDGDHRPMMRWISVAISSTVPVPGTRCTMPRWAKCAMSGAVSRWYT